MKLELITREGKRWYRLLEDYEFDCGVIVPEGFEWNGASSPPVASWIIPKAHKTLIASCIHDYLCGLATNKRDRKKADKVFEGELNKDHNVVTSKLGYWGVRIGSLFGIGNSF